MNKEHGFTLAEILITLAIIGVVAAMTIPTLIAKINDIVTTNQMAVFNAKLIKGLNLTKTAGDLNDTYTSTYDFLENGLGKNIKFAKICDSSHIRDCIPYDTIKYMKGDSEESKNVKDIKTAGAMTLNAPFKDTAAFVLADGTTAIVSYNLKCIDDPDKADTTINACLAGVYDINGSRKPNKFGSKVVEDKTVYTGDVKGFNGAAIGPCNGIIGNICITSGYMVPNNDMIAAIQAVDSSYVVPKSGGLTIYWQVARDYCSKVQKASLPSEAQLFQIASALYEKNDGTKVNITLYADGLVMKNKEAIYSALGIADNPASFRLFSADRYDSIAHVVQYQPTFVSRYDEQIVNASPIICIGSM